MSAAGIAQVAVKPLPVAANGQRVEEAEKIADWDGRTCALEKVMRDPWMAVLGRE